MSRQEGPETPAAPGETGRTEAAPDPEREGDGEDADAARPPRYPVSERARLEAELLADRAERGPDPREDPE